MMETIFPFALWCFTSLFTITSPLSTMPVFLTMTQSLDEKERRAVAIRSTLVACCALLLFVLAGQFLFKFFGISTNGFRIVGGIIIFRIGFDMLQAKYTPMNLRKEEIKEYIEGEFNYNLDRTLDEIRPGYHMDETCQRTVPEAIIAFLESKDFEDAVRNAVSLGGDTDTLGAITGSIAEAFYGIPAVLIAECKSRIDKGMMTDVLDEFDHVLGRSVDTYSDEVDETQANQMIEAAIRPVLYSAG